ncbi:hypothetical protein [Microvirga sp. VF16]|uniref:hypothetical protein n=1 Tax=Microvirga sp. VF16 TaxID=2807101 RepID=UPI00193E811F|nr:hypothetical protein [Microvirga sp. VF16]QRM35080.1 hypothetical protein JO965_39450 [Microvirga sp. VF16]
MKILRGSTKPEVSQARKHVNELGPGFSWRPIVGILMLVAGGMAAGWVGILIVLGIGVAIQVSTARDKRKANDPFQEHLEGRKLDYYTKAPGGRIGVDVTNRTIILQLKMGKTPTTFELTADDIRDWSWRVEGYSWSSFSTNPLTSQMKQDWEEITAKAHAAANSGMFITTNNIDHPELFLRFGIGPEYTMLLKKWDEVLTQFFEGVLPPQNVTKVIQ